MKTNTVSVQEVGLNIYDGQNMIFKIIDNQINNYKLQFMTDWERDHNTSPNEKNRKIEKLEAEKEKLRNYFKNIDSQKTDLSFSLNLEIVLHDKEHSTNAEEKLVMSYAG